MSPETGLLPGHSTQQQSRWAIWRVCALLRARLSVFHRAAATAGEHYGEQHVELFQNDDTSRRDFIFVFGVCR